MTLGLGYLAMPERRKCSENDRVTWKEHRGQQHSLASVDQYGVT